MRIHDLEHDSGNYLIMDGQDCSCDMHAISHGLRARVAVERGMDVRINQVFVYGVSPFRPAHVSCEITAVTLTRAIRRSFLAIRTARMLPAGDRTKPLDAQSPLLN